MIPGVDLIDFIVAVSIVGVAMVIFAESGLLIGFFLPGDSLLFTTGFLINASILPININLAVLLVFLAAVAGDSVGYWFGKKTGPTIFNKPDAKIFKQEFIEKSQEFYQKHGGKTIVIARFIPIIRTFAPIVAGASKMKYKNFIIYNVIGALLWAAGVTYLGFFLGSWFKHIGLDIDVILLPIVLVIIILSILPPMLHILTNTRRRRKLFAKIKKLFTPTSHR